MPSEDIHSLTAEIYTDFSQSIEDIADFQSKIAEMNKSFGTLSAQVDDTYKSMSNLDFKLGKELAKVAEEIKDGSMVFNGVNIKAKIEKSLIDAINKRGIIFEGFSNDSEGYTVKILQKNLNELKKKVKDYLNDAVLNIDVPKSIGEGVTVTLTDQNLVRLKERFQNVLSAAIDDHVDFKAESDEKINEFAIKNSQINKVLDSFRDKFDEILKNPEFVRLDSTGLRPITFSSKQMEEALAAVQNSIGDVDKHLGGIDQQALKDLPPIGPKLKEFSAHVAGIIVRVNDVLAGIDTLKADDKQFGYKQLAHSIGEMQNTIITKTEDIVKDVTNMVANKGLPARDYSSTLKILEGAQDQIQAYLMRLMAHANQEIESAMGMQTKEISGQKFKAPSLHRLQEAIEKAAQEAIRGLDVGDLSMETGKTVELFQKWSAQTVGKMDTEWVKALGPLQTHLLAGHKQVMDQFVDSIMSLTKLNVKSDDTLEKIDIEIDMKEMRKSLEKQMVTIAETLVGNVDFTPAGKKAMEAGIKLPKSVADTLNEQVRDLLVSQTNRLASQLNSRQGLNFSEAHLEKFDSELFKESTNMINNIVKQAQEITKSLADGIQGSGFKNFSGDEQEQIKKHFSESGTKMIEDYTSMMDNALGAFKIAGGVAEHMQKQIQQALSEVLKTRTIEFDDAKTPILLQGVMKIAQDKLQDAIAHNMRLWEPDFDGFEFNLNWNNITDPLQQGLNGLLNQVGQQVGRHINSIVMPNKNQIDSNQKMMTNVEEPDAVLSTKDLHKDTRKFLADQNEMSVKDWAKMIPSYSGADGVAEVMAANVAVIMAKFHATIGRNVKNAVELYDSQLSKVNTPPNTVAVNFLALKLDQLNETLNKKIRSAIDSQMNEMMSAIKGIKLKNVSMSFEGADFNEAFREFIKSNVKNASAHAKKGSTAFDESMAGSEPGRKGETRSMDYTRIDSSLPAILENMMPSTFFSKINRNTGGGGSFSPEDETDLYLRGTRVAYENTKNRFRDKLSPDMEAQLHDYLDNRYIPEVKRIAAIPNDKDNAAQIRYDKTFIAQELKMAVEMARKELMGEKLSDSNDGLRNRLNYFAQDQELNAEGIKTRFLNRIDGDQYGALSTIMDEMVARANRIAKKPVSGFQNTLDAEMAMKNLKQEVKAVTEMFSRLAKENQFGHQVDKLSDKMQNLVAKGDLPLTLFEQFQAKMDGINSTQDLDNAKLFYRDMVDQQRVIDKQKRDEQRDEESLASKQSRLKNVLGFYQENSLLNSERNERSLASKLNPESSSLLREELGGYNQRVRDLSSMPIDSVDNIDSVKQSMKELNLVLKSITDRYRAKAKDDRKGDLLTQNELLKGNVNLQNQVLQQVLKTVPALQDYRVEQIRVNNASDTWSARMKDAEGNVRSLSGSLDRATGELFQHSEALSLVSQKAGALRYGGGGGGYAPGNQNFMDRYSSNPNISAREEANPNGDFGSSIMNTMRYITAGALIGAPSAAMWQAWESNKEFDYNMERARQNFVIKGDLADKPMTDVAIRRVSEANPGQTFTKDDPEVEAERAQLASLAQGKESRKLIQEMAIANKIPIEEAAKAFHIGSRSVDDPNEALAITSAVAKAKSIEDTDTEVAAKGLEAIMNQYNIRGYATDKVMDMMIMAAQKSPATLEDQLQMQQRAGAIFAGNLPGMDKGEQISTSIGLGSIFAQATARSGAEGGTFFKALLPRFTTGPGLESLENVSKQAGFEDLNPYNADGSQKNFIDIFTTFLDHSMKLSDKDRLQLWKDVVPGWHLGSTEAMTSFLTGLQGDLDTNIVGKMGKNADSDKDGTVSRKEALEQYFSEIHNVNDGQIAMLREGTNSTWDRQIQGIQTQFSASFTNVTDEFKDEFSSFATVLTVLLRTIGEHADGFAQSISLASKIAIGLGAKYAWNKLGETIDKADKEKKEQKYGKVDRYLGAEQRALKLQRIGIEEELGATPEQNKKRAARIQELTELRDGFDQERSDKMQKRDQLVKDVNDITSGSNREAYPGQLDYKREQLQIMQDTLNQGPSQKEHDVNRELAELSREAAQAEGRTKKLNDELKENDRAMTAVNNRVRMLGESYTDMGLDSSLLKTQVSNVNNEFREGVQAATTYDQAIEKVGDTSSTSQISRLRQEIDKLNDELSSGKLSATAYAKEIEKLERAHMTGVAGVAGGGVGKAASGQAGFGLAEAVVGGSLLGGSLLGRGMITRMKDFSKTKSLKSLFGKGETMMDPNLRNTPMLDRNNQPIIYEDVLREDRARTSTASRGSRLFGGGRSVAEAGGAARGLSKVGALAKFGKGVPVLGQALAAYSAIKWGSDAIAARGMKDEEKNVERASNLENLANNVKGTDAYRWSHPGEALMKVGTGIGNLGEMAFQGVNNWMGGNGVSFKDSWKMLSGSAKYDGKDLDKNFENSFGDITQKVLDAQSALAKALDPSLETDPAGDSLEEKTPEQKAAEELEELNEKVSKIEGEFSRETSKNNSQFDIDKSKLLISGVAEDSEQMRQLFEEYIEKNILFIDSAIASLETEKNGIKDKNSEEYKNLETRQKELESEKAKSELELKNSQMSEYDEVMKKLAEDLKKTETEYGIQKDDAILNGADPDSEIMKKIETQKTNESNGLIEGAQGELEDLIRENNLQGSDLKKVQDAILELEKDQKDNLVAIKQQMERNKATFNLPSGVQAVSYMDHMMSKNTHKSVTAKAGDVTVNVTIGNMGGTANDAQKLGESLADAIKKANQQAAAGFNRQVATGFGNGY
ncbi:phage tail tape measure protein [Peribacillus frigoritolerans]|uniref:Phage tail tape measure protein n=1 Tax=Peribacillus castrilensis TaxID=2897690 RepID=A0AAW9NQ01_9BACI|nr:phage tail tape measure protein [Peribacillus castrilensis]